MTRHLEFLKLTHHLAGATPDTRANIWQPFGNLAWSFAFPGATDSLLHSRIEEPWFVAAAWSLSCS